MGRLYIVIRRDAEFERIEEVEAKEAVIGRSNECSVWLPDPCVSREHAVIVEDRARFLIRDLGSRNGTVLNGRQIQNEEVLVDGTEVQISPYRLKICFDMDAALQNAPHSDNSTHVRHHRGAVDDIERQVMRLTRAQRRVYDLFLEGLLEKEVAVRLGITVHTVHDHAKAVYKTLSVSTRAELISRWATRQT